MTYTTELGEKAILLQEAFRRCLPTALALDRENHACREYADGMPMAVGANPDGPKGG